MKKWSYRGSAGQMDKRTEEFIRQFDTVRGPIKVRVVTSLGVPSIFNPLIFIFIDFTLLLFMHTTLH